MLIKQDELIGSTDVIDTMYSPGKGAGFNISGITHEPDCRDFIFFKYNCSALIRNSRYFVVNNTPAERISVIGGIIYIEKVGIGAGKIDFTRRTFAGSSS